MKNLTVLIVDDDAFFRRMLTKALARHGFQVIEAYDGEQALQLLKAFEVALIITDIHMPGMNGVELIKALREFEVKPEVLAISGGRFLFPKEKSLTQAEKLGVFATLAKPFPMNELLNHVEDALNLGDIYHDFYEKVAAF